jgi:hypothetical protein
MFRKSLNLLGSVARDEATEHIDVVVAECPSAIKKLLIISIAEGHAIIENNSKSHSIIDRKTVIKQ